MVDRNSTPKMQTKIEKNNCEFNQNVDQRRTPKIHKLQKFHQKAD